MTIKTKYMMGSSSVDVIKMSDETALDSLPAQVYTISFNEFRGFYLNITKQRLKVPDKIYGNAYHRVGKCIKTYTDRPTSTGILMTGDKGTGKTLLMSLLANRVIEDLNMPVILVRAAYSWAL